jgi:helicase
MNFFNIGISGSTNKSVPIDWSELEIPSSLRSAAKILTNDSAANPLQIQAIRQGLLNCRRNVLVSSPTNSGKTLVGYFILLEALSRGKRAVLLEPLRALAREKADELERLASKLGEAIGRPFRVRVSTGDYRLEGETFSDPAPGAELIIATPERMESILRVPENIEWFSQLGAVCVDEAHLLSEPRRGATLEYLITSLLTLDIPPRLVLLSATIGSTDKVTKWLQPCDVLSVTDRIPPLDKWLVDLSANEEANVCIAEWLKQELLSNGSQALIFIHQARQTASTAMQLTGLLGSMAGQVGVLPYNSKMSFAQREQVRQQFMRGDSRVLVTTSALAMGVNLPATHVVVRDLTYVGARSPGVSEILQMMGRAGRGNRNGKALVIKRHSDSWQTSELIELLRNEQLPEIVSALAYSEAHQKRGDAPIAADAVASLLLRAGNKGKSQKDIESFFLHSLGGRPIVQQVPAVLRWIQHNNLGYPEETTEQYKLTVLGERAVRAVLPLPVAAGFGRLLRDLISLDDDKEYLGRWSPLDFLILLELLYNDTPNLRKFSAELVKQVIAWCEGHAQLVPMLFRCWLRGEKGHSNASEVLGSLGVEPTNKVSDRDEWARQRGYLAMFNAIILYERAMGRSITDLERQYGFNNLEGVEERWRDTMLWLLSGLSQLLEVRAYYYHLREECNAPPERIKTVKRFLMTMHRQSLELMEQIKFASPLGGLVLAMRRRKGKAGVGIESIRRMEDAGITRIAQIAQLSPEQLSEFGLRKDIARRIASHLRASRV